MPGLDAGKGARLTDVHVYALVHFVLLLNCELCKGKVGVVWAWPGRGLGVPLLGICLITFITIFDDV